MCCHGGRCQGRPPSSFLCGFACAIRLGVGLLCRRLVARLGRSFVGAGHPRHQRPGSQHQPDEQAQDSRASHPQPALPRDQQIQKAPPPRGRGLRLDRHRRLDPRDRVPIDRVGEHHRLVALGHAIQVRRSESPQQRLVAVPQVGEKAVVRFEQPVDPPLRRLQPPQVGPVLFQRPLGGNDRRHEDDHEPGGDPQPARVESKEGRTTVHRRGYRSFGTRIPIRDFTRYQCCTAKCRSTLLRTDQLAWPARSTGIRCSKCSSTRPPSFSSFQS